MQLIIWFALKWVNGEIGEMGEIYEMVNSVKWVNGEISEMGEMANSVKSGFCPGPPEKQKFSTSTLQELTRLHILPVNSLVQLLTRAFWKISSNGK